MDAITLSLFCVISKLTLSLCHSHSLTLTLRCLHCSLLIYISICIQQTAICLPTSPSPPISCCLGFVIQYPSNPTLLFVSGKPTTRLWATTSLPSTPISTRAFQTAKDNYGPDPVLGPGKHAGTENSPQVALHHQRLDLNSILAGHHASHLASHLDILPRGSLDGMSKITHRKRQSTTTMTITRAKRKKIPTT